MGVWSSFQLQLSPPPTPPTGTLQHPQAPTVHRATLPALLGQLPLRCHGPAGLGPQRCLSRTLISVFLQPNHSKGTCYC